MSGPNCPDAMSTDTESTAPAQKKGDFWVWAGVLFGVAEINLIRWLTDWPWWIYSAPAVGVGVIAVA